MAAFMVHAHGARILLLLLILPCYAHAQTNYNYNSNNYNNPSTQSFNTLSSNYNPNQPGYNPPSNQGLQTQWGSNNPQGQTPNYSPFMDLKGKYCETRRQQCCPNRRDECSVPVLGTFCYCDVFCDRVKNPDCCPDFYSVCRGITPPPELIQPKPQPCQLLLKSGKKILINPGASYTHNCNTWKCERIGITSKTELNGIEDPCMINEEALETMNRDRRSTWTASNHTMFWGHKSEKGLVQRTGALNPDDLSKRMYPILLTYDEDQIPATFDARNPPRQSHPVWAGKVGDIRDQGWCGSSWALATLGVAEDRLAISSAVKGLEIKETLSPQQLISCERGQRGCGGGHMDRVWMYLRKRGVVTESCSPYTSSNGETGTCPFPRRFGKNIKCPSGEESIVYQFEPAYRIASEESDIMFEILQNGPVQALMKVRDDFFMYQKGIYSHIPTLTNNAKAEYHAVRIVGWGTESFANRQTTKYWYVANTWGKSWGERGFFRIKRGSNESEIESFILAVRPRLDKFARNTRQRRLIDHKQYPQNYIRKNHHQNLKHNAGY